ncbi:ABC transporter ATP-binding protein [Roseinatronobacter sp. NSM]|uniref:ABC transporter ATP-binding protein n=1 Tax=Roseinatronobacter sp. NSM TaxID=3457785 RepID=UPI004035784B
MQLKIRNLEKYYGQFQALSDVDLDVGDEEFVCLLGPSGCGKTTLLRIIAGLEPYNAGTLELAGKDLSTVGAQHRGFGIVFQSYSLFQHMTVADNIGYGLRIRKTPSAERDAKVQKLMELVHLQSFAQRYPYQLSGGQQQRVAIARALAVDPALLLLDEPLSALDARVRNDLRLEIRDVQRRLRIPTIMVTHDQEEALIMADKIVCMNAGKIEQIGTPKEIYSRPRTRFVADFVGISNFLTPQLAQTVLPDLGSHPPDAQHLLALRPEDISVSMSDGAQACITQASFLGNVTRLTVDLGETTLLAESHHSQGLKAGDRVAISVAPDAGVWVRA